MEHLYSSRREEAESFSQEHIAQKGHAQKRAQADNQIRIIFSISSEKSLATRNQDHNHLRFPFSGCLLRLAHRDFSPCFTCFP